MGRPKGLRITFTCPHCDEAVTDTLAVWWFDEPPAEANPILLAIAYCDSGGVYDVHIECPQCSGDIDLKR